ncbi:kti12, chromatin associated [Linderina pennispora]|nr:kti12, chromatin associated [Linderina pennispora]
MPLIILTGYPSSGKSTRAAELKQLFEQRISQPENSNRILTVQVVSDDQLGVPHSAYATANEEKKARGTVMSAVQRHLSRECIVIVDSLNYIKGFRYQLFCVAREMSTPHCVIHCAIPIEEARRINDSRQAQGYDATVFEELVMRYEEPNAATKWDSPLFTIVQHMNDPIPFDKVWDAVVEKKAPPPTFATAVKPVTGGNYLFEFDRATQEVITAVLDAQKSGVPMSEIAAPGSGTKVQMPGRNVTLAELRRLRRQFTNLNRMATPKIDRVPELFVDYLNTNL